MDYRNPVLYSVKGGYLVLRLIATVNTVPIYALAGGPFQTVEEALFIAAHVAEQKV